MTGYVKVFRKVLDNPNSTNPLWLAVWSYILLRASHKEYWMNFDGEMKQLEAGQLVCSSRQIARFFNTSKDTVNRILNVMEKGEMLRREVYNRKTVFTVLKWVDYQVVDTRTSHELATNRDANRDANRDTNKKIEDINIDDSAKTKKASKKKKEAGTLSKAREVMAEFNARAGKDYKDHASSEHLGHIRARFADGFTKEEMIEVIDHKVDELKGTENEAKWLNPSTLFKPRNFERNLDWARTKDSIKLAQLRKEYMACYKDDPFTADQLKRQMADIRNGKPAQQGS
jgi:uncharacterized phage protein (TIGR02220 family)